MPKPDELARERAESWFAAGCAQLEMRRYGAARASLERALALTPESGAVAFNLGKALFALGHVDAAVARFGLAAALDPAAGAVARGSIATVIPGSPAADNLAVLRARRAWAADLAAGIAPVAVAARAGGKLRIGYVSAFFGARNWMKPVFGVINRHRRAAFEIHMIADGAPPAAASGYRDHDEDFIHDIDGVGNAEAAAIIGGLGLDVLVDLNGYGVPQRLAMIMARPAPVVAGWFNMFATTGMAAFDWIIGDEAVIPAPEADFYSEHVHRLPGSYLAFEVRYPVPDVVAPPCGGGGGVTFGCLGSQYKLTDGVLESWARILRAAPGSKLFLKNAALEDESTRAEVLGRLSGLGVAPARVTLAGRSEHFAFLDAYRDVDIALDTFPYNGGTTTSEALWQGVPVLSFDGGRWASRTSKSLLLAAGMPEWVAADQAGYEASAIELANNPGTPAMLAALRSGMREKLRHSAACDTETLCRALEDFYQSVSGAGVLK